MFFLGDLFYTSKSERERFNVHVKSSPSVYTFKSTVRLKNVSGSGTSTVYAGGGKRQGGKGLFANTNVNENYFQSYGEIKPFEPNIFERFYTSKYGKNIFSKLIYGIVDDAWVSSTCWVLGSNRAFHLSGAYAVGDEVMTSGVSTLTNLMPLGSVSKYLGIGKKTLNAGQFNKLMKSTGITSATNHGKEILKYNYTIKESLRFNINWKYYNYGFTMSTFYLNETLK